MTKIPTTRHGISSSFVSMSFVLFIHDKTLMRKFFFDSKQLLTEGGSLVLSLYNYDVFCKAPLVELPVRESLRTKLFSEIITKDDGSKVLVQNIETGNGKLLPVFKDEAIYPLTPEEIENFAREAGFKSVTFYADWERNTFTGTEESYVVVISK